MLPSIEYPEGVPPVGAHQAEEVGAAVLQRHVHALVVVHHAPRQPRRHLLAVGGRGEGVKNLDEKPNRRFFMPKEKKELRKKGDKYRMSSSRI